MSNDLSICSLQILLSNFSFIFPHNYDNIQLTLSSKPLMNSHVRLINQKFVQIAGTDISKSFNSWQPALLIDKMKTHGIDKQLTQVSHSNHVDFCKNCFYIWISRQPVIRVCFCFPFIIQRKKNSLNIAQSPLKCWSFRIDLKKSIGYSHPF